LWIEHHAGNKHSLDENIQPKVSKPSGGDISEYQTKMFDRLCNNPGRSKDHELLNPEIFFRYALSANLPQFIQAW